MCGAELKTLPEGVQRVAQFLQASGHAHAPVMLDDAARTAQQAADALGVAVGQIAKSIIFRRKSDDAAVLVVTSGDQRVDEKKVEALVCPDGRRLGRADARSAGRAGFARNRRARSPRGCGSAVAVGARRGTLGKRAAITPGWRYSVRKSWPQCETQCVSSIANSATGRLSNIARRSPISRRSGDT